MKLIDETLKQEKAADQLLTKIAESGVNTEARYMQRASKATRVTTTKVEDNPMRKILSAAALTLVASTATFAQQPGQMSPPVSAQQSGAMSPSSTATLMAMVPGDCVTVTNYYKQNVYDPFDSKIGEIADVLVNKEGRITGVIISVGGFLGMGEKDVAAPFEAILATQKGNESYLVINTNAPGYKYDRNTTKWVSDKSKDRF